MTWAAAPVLAFAVRGRAAAGALAAAMVAAADVVHRGGIFPGTVHNIVLLVLLGTVVGYLVGLAQSSERALARALALEAATAERERLARDIHDGVLQVLALVERRGAEAGGEAAELGRLAGEQQVALRTLVGARRVPVQAGGRSPERSRPGEPGGPRDLRGPGDPGDAGDRGDVRDLRDLLAALATSRVSVSGPATAVLLPAPVADELAAAVATALHNVERHAGPGARAWVLIEDESGEVVVSVRDDGVGIAPGRLEQAEGEGRLGVALSLRGRVQALGGTVALRTGPGRGTELELRLPTAAVGAPTRDVRAKEVRAGGAGGRGGGGRGSAASGGSAWGGSA